MKHLIPFLLLFLLFTASAQNEIKLMHYNLLYYDRPTTYCTTDNNPTDTKNEALREIFGFVRPDILCVNEMNASSASIDLLMSETLNINGVSYYKRANWTGDYSINAMYYDSRKLQLTGQASFDIPLGSNTGHVDVYRMNALTEPVTPIAFISMHPKAGNTTNDAADRTTATSTLMYNIENGYLGIGSNYVLAGDLNFYKASEQGYQNLINYSNAAYRFYDPIDQEGEWTNNYAYADYHTQSTHSSGECAAGGGMDDRFDFILVSPAIQNHTNAVSYDVADYVTVGQDGSHFNDAVNDGTNNSASAEVIDALYTASDHLPVTLKFQLDNPLLYVGSEFVQKDEIRYTNPIVNSLNIEFDSPVKQNTQIKIYNSLGVLVSTSFPETGNLSHRIEFSNMPTGIYFAVIQNENSKQKLKLVK